MCVSGSIARAFRYLLLLALCIGSAALAAPRCDMRVMSYNIRLDLASGSINV